MEAVVIATNRVSSFLNWLDKWVVEFLREGVQVFVMHDSDGSDTSAIKQAVNGKGKVFTHRDVEYDLGDKAWIIPKGTSACKSYAIYKAWKAGMDRIYCLDDDCYPDGLWVITHRMNLQSRENNTVFRTIDGVRPRGVPYLEERPVMLSHGAWVNIPDVDAVTQLNGYGIAELIEGAVPEGCLFPFCGMNWGCNREIAPLMYFGLQGKEWGVDRFDDIWCGFVAKKIMDHLGYAVVTGAPTVKHIRESNALENIIKESPGYGMNVEFWKFCMKHLLFFGETPIQCMDDAAGNIIQFMKDEYWQKYGEAIQIWATLFKDPS